MMAFASHPDIRPGHQRRWSMGMTLVELLVGMAVGLIVLAGTITLYSKQLRAARQGTLELRMQQDLRNTMDLVVRELRRAGYWGGALAATQAPDSHTNAANPYAPLSTPSASQIDYRYARDAAQDHLLSPATEQFGFRLNNATHALQIYTGTSWQTLTNTDLFTIPANGFVITPQETTLDLRDACVTPCTDSPSAPTCPKLTVRSYRIELTGLSRTDESIRHTLQAQVRVRNDARAGACPV